MSMMHRLCKIYVSTLYDIEQIYILHSFLQKLVNDIIFKFFIKFWIQRSYGDFEVVKNKHFSKRLGCNKIVKLHIDILFWFRRK